MRIFLPHLIKDSSFVPYSSCVLCSYIYIYIYILYQVFPEGNYVDCNIPFPLHLRISRICYLYNASETSSAGWKGNNYPDIHLLLSFVYLLSLHFSAYYCYLLSNIYIYIYNIYIYNIQGALRLS